MKRSFIHILMMLAMLSAYTQGPIPDHVCGLDTSIWQFDLQSKNKDIPLDHELYGYLDKLTGLFHSGIVNVRYTLREIHAYRIAAAHFQRINQDAPRVITINHQYYASLADHPREKEALLIWILAHELTHHIAGDMQFNTNASQAHNLTKEIHADRIAGFAVGKLTNVDIDFFYRILPLVLSHKKTSPTHPSSGYRIAAARAGWMEAQFNAPTERRASPMVLKKIGGRKYLSQIEGSLSYIGRISSQKRWFGPISARNRDNNTEFMGHVTLSQRGWGVIVSPFIDIYFGEWQNGMQRNGYGELYDYEGNAYTGEFKDGLKHGTGKYILANGESYEGDFIHGRLEGFGTYRYLDGRKYVGKWSKGKRHGQGIIYKGNVVIQQGCWRNGAFIGESCQ